MQFGRPTFQDGLALANAIGGYRDQRVRRQEEDRLRDREHQQEAAYGLAMQGYDAQTMSDKYGLSPQIALEAGTKAIANMDVHQKWGDQQKAREADRFLNEELVRARERGEMNVVDALVRAERPGGMDAYTWHAAQARMVNDIVSHDATKKQYADFVRAGLIQEREELNATLEYARETGKHDLFIKAVNEAQGPETFEKTESGNYRIRYRDPIGLGDLDSDPAQYVQDGREFTFDEIAEIFHEHAQSERYMPWVFERHRQNAALRQNPAIVSKGGESMMMVYQVAKNGEVNFLVYDGTDEGTIYRNPNELRDAGVKFGEQVKHDHDILYRQAQIASQRALEQQRLGGGEGGEGQAALGKPLPDPEVARIRSYILEAIQGLNVLPTAEMSAEAAKAAHVVDTLQQYPQFSLSGAQYIVMEELARGPGWEQRVNERAAVQVRGERPAPPDPAVQQIVTQFNSRELPASGRGAWAEAHLGQWKQQGLSDEEIGQRIRLLPPEIGELFYGAIQRMNEGAGGAGENAEQADDGFGLPPAPEEPRVVAEPGQYDPSPMGGESVQGVPVWQLDKHYELAVSQSRWPLRAQRGDVNNPRLAEDYPAEAWQALSPEEKYAVLEAYGALPGLGRALRHAVPGR